jgi:hypothetical protein
VHDQVDGASASGLFVPVEELQTGDRDGAAIRTPTMAILPITVRSPCVEDKFQRKGTNRIGPLSKIPKVSVSEVHA